MVALASLQCCKEKSASTPLPCQHRGKELIPPLSLPELSALVRIGSNHMFPLDLRNRLTSPCARTKCRLNWVLYGALRNESSHNTSSFQNHKTEAPGDGKYSFFAILASLRWFVLDHVLVPCEGYCVPSQVEHSVVVRPQRQSND